MRAAWILGSALAAGISHAGPPLKQAAALYYQGRYDSALEVLSECRSAPLRRRDSLALFQYSGMASARLGRTAEAREDFRALLALDSLFQFPRNEDSAVLAAFSAARAPRGSDADAPGGGPGTQKMNPPATAAAATPGTAVAAGAGTAVAGMPGTAAGAAPATPVSPGPGTAAQRAPATAAAAAPGTAVASAPGPAPAYPALGPSAASGARPVAGEGGNGGPGLGPGPRGIGLAMGAIPLGGGWLARGRNKQGLTLALLQAGGMAFSIYASSRQTPGSDPDGIREGRLGSERGWQLAQRVSLSIAVGAYLFSLIASKGE